MAPPVIAIVGRPNVGKSTLFNRLVGRRKALVGDLPGITRDRNYAMAEFDGRPFLLIDTGGFLPESRDPLLEQMKTQVRLAVEEADAVILVLDAKEGLNPLDREVHGFLRRSGKDLILAVNKVDGPRQEAAVYEFYALGEERLFPVSAEHALGVEALMEEVVHPFPRTESARKGGITRISVIGKPNAGKSTLINALVGEDRLITSEVPGTTRDAIDTPFRYRDRDYILVDTAGIRRKARVTQRIETYSVIMVLKSIEDSDLCLVLVDAAEGVTEQDIKVAGLAHEAGKAAILLVNKWDLLRGKTTPKAFVGELRRKIKFMDYAPVLLISARTGSHLRDLFPLIETVEEAYVRRVPTARVNRVLREAVAAHEPPFHRRSRVRFFYGTQADIAPPTFILFVSNPAGVHFSYLRYLTNTFRKELGFGQVPIRIFLKKRK